MAPPQPETPVTPPSADGDTRTYVNAEAAQSSYFNRDRRVLYVNGIQTAGPYHMEMALDLSLLQMCTVVGVYNKSDGFISDFGQCIADKWQFRRGPASVLGAMKMRVNEADAREALSRNPCQVVIFDLLRRPENRKMEVYAHSQGNLLMSNVFEAISMVDGPDAIKGWKVNTFGSPAVHWPAGLDIQEYGFTFDGVNMMSGPNVRRSISKVGWPGGTAWPFTHGFDWYMKEDPAFTVNRFRTGGWKMTFNMDEEGLAKALIAMGTNMPRVRRIFDYLDEYRNSDADDVAEYYLDEVRTSRPDIASALARDTALRERLAHILDKGFTSSGEKRDSDYVKSLR